MRRVRKQLFQRMISLTSPDDIIGNTGDRMKYGNKDHTFVICAYKESPYLEDCIRSVTGQTVCSSVMIVTSTPNTFIRKTADKYQIPLICNHGEAGIAGDWNFAIKTAKTPLVTIAHQDDIYGRHYLEAVLQAASFCSHPLILFTDYDELRDGKIVRGNRLLRVKRLMLSPLKIKACWKSIWVRRRILSMGSAICCPSVTIVKKNVSLPVFENNMKSNIDWQAWEKMSREKGEFAYIPSALMLHRIHRDSTTSQLLEKDQRRVEDLYMYRKFWPEWIAEIFEHFYQSAEKSNEINGKL